MVRGRFGTQHHPPKVAGLKHQFVTRRNDAIISLVWLVVVVVLGIALIAGAVKVATDFSATFVYRWIMAAMFLGGSVAWLTSYYRETLRRYFKR